MTKAIQNTIISSPVKKVAIGKYSIKLYGQDNGYDRFNQNITPINPLEFEDKKQLEQFLSFISSKTNIVEQFLSFISSKTNIDSPINKEITEAIDNFHPECTLQPIVSNLYTKMQDSIESELKKAQLSNKKLLILIGEDHKSWDSFVLELLALDICKKNNIYNFFAETCPETLQIISTHKSIHFWETYNNGDHYDLLYRTALKNDMLLHLVDPLNFESMEGKVTYKQRADKMNEVLLCTPGDAILCVGAAHVIDIISEKSLSSKYEILALNTVHSANILAAYHTLPWSYRCLNRKKLDERQQGCLNSDKYDDLMLLEQVIAMRNIKDMSQLKNKVTDLFISPDQNKIVVSATQALNILTNTISAHNPGSPTLETLSAISDVYKKAQDVFYTSPSWNNKCQQMYEQLISPTKDQKNLRDEFNGLNKQELSYFSHPKNHLADIVDIDLAGGDIINYQENPDNLENWDVSGD